MNLLLACVTTLFGWKQEKVALAILIAFCGLLRIGEALGLEWRDLHFPVSSEGRAQVVIVLHRTKRGVEEKVGGQWSAFERMINTEI